MGLDVSIMKSKKTGVTWEEAEADFPFTPVTETYSDYDYETGDYIGERESAPFIAEITGPLWTGFEKLSFRGRGYSDLPFLSISLWGRVGRRDLKKMQKELHLFLEQHADADPEWVYEEGFLRMKRIRWFAQLIDWIVAHRYTLDGNF